MGFFDLLKFIKYQMELLPPNGVSYSEVKKSLQNQEFSFDCTKCGKCCTGRGNVYFSIQDMQNLKKFLNLNLEEWKFFVSKVFSFRRNGYFIHKTYTKCYFLDENKKCTIYPIRPLQCRTFPFWPFHFKSKNHLLTLVNNCPGSNVNQKNQLQKYTIYPQKKIFLLCNQTIKKFNRYQTIQIKEKKDYIVL